MAPKDLYLSAFLPCAAPHHEGVNAAWRSEESCAITPDLLSANQWDIANTGTVRGCIELLYRPTLKWLPVEPTFKSTHVPFTPCCCLLMSGIRIIETTLSVLSLISSVRAAFSTAICDSYGECVQKNAYGVWCFSTKYTSNYASCPSPWALPLQTHLNQNLSIAYYSPNGQFLGGTDYHVPGTGQTYLCMSARVDPNQNATLCVLAAMDNTWYIDKYCFVDVVPSATKDGCFNSGVSGSLVDTTFHYLTSTSFHVASLVFRHSYSIS